MNAPVHARLLASAGGDSSARGFDDAGAEVETFLAIFLILHVLCALFKILEFSRSVLIPLSGLSVKLLQVGD